jgi:hypothetical protein
MASQQFIPSSQIPSRTLSPQQFLDLLEILRELDLDLHFASGVPDAGMLKIAFPISCARAFLRAHEALEDARTERAEPVSSVRTTFTDPVGELLNPDLAFSTTTELTAWIDAVEHYVAGYLERTRL